MEKNFFDKFDEESSNETLKVDKIKKGTNTISIILRVVAWIILILGIILGCILGQNEYGDFEFSLALQTWLIYGGVFLGVYSLGEIIQILHDIRFKVWKK